jgi:hypothetical protein
MKMSDLPKLLFLIQAHAVDEQLLWLLEWLGHDGDQRMLSLDCDPRGHTFESVMFSRSPPVTWGGYSQVSTYLECLKSALALPDWDYAINLSGTCFPIKPLLALKNFLKPRQDTATSLLAGVPCGMPRITATPRFSQVQYVDTGMLAARDIRLLCEDQISQFFQIPQESPIFELQQRLNYHVEEIQNPKTLLVRALEPSEAEVRVQLLSELVLHFGRAWYCFHRSGAEQLVQMAAPSKAMALLKHAFEPDELLIHTLLFGSPTPLRIENRNLHAWWGDPRDIDAPQWTDAHLSDDFFVRKVTARNFASVLSIAASHV